MQENYKEKLSNFLEQQTGAEENSEFRLSAFIAAISQIGHCIHVSKSDPTFMTINMRKSNVSMGLDKKKRATVLSRIKGIN